MLEDVIKEVEEMRKHQSKRCQYSPNTPKSLQTSIAYEQGVCIGIGKVLSLLIKKKRRSKFLKLEDVIKQIEERIKLRERDTQPWVHEKTIEENCTRLGELRWVLSLLKEKQKEQQQS